MIHRRRGTWNRLIPWDEFRVGRFTSASQRRKRQTAGDRRSAAVVSRGERVEVSPKGESLLAAVPQLLGPSLNQYGPASDSHTSGPNGYRLALHSSISARCAAGSIEAARGWQPAIKGTPTLTAVPKRSAFLVFLRGGCTAVVSKFRARPGSVGRERQRVGGKK